MKFIPSTLLALDGLATATPIKARDTTYQVNNFYASKEHLSSYDYFSFNVSIPSIDSPVTCATLADSGSSFSTTLAFVFNQTCSDAGVTWSLSGSSNYTIRVATAGLGSGSHFIPASDVTVEEHPDDLVENDVFYSGPSNFSINVTAV